MSQSNAIYTYWQFESLIIGKLIASECKIKKAIASQVSILGLGSDRKRWETWFKDYEVSKKWNFDRDWSNSISQMKSSGSGSKELALSIYYRLHSEEKYWEQAYEIDLEVFKLPFHRAKYEPVFKGIDHDKLLLKRIENQEQPKIKQNVSQEANVANSIVTDELDYNKAKYTERWHLKDGDLESIDKYYCSLEVEPAQNSFVGQPLGLLLRVNVRHFETDCGVKYGMKMVGIKVDSENSFVQHNDLWEKPKIETGNVKTELVGTGIDRILEIEATSNSLYGKYELNSDVFCTVNSSREQSTFELVMLAKRFSISITNTDGTKLGDVNKRAVIASIIAKRIGDEIDGGWIPVAKKMYHLTRSIKSSAYSDDF